MNIIDVARCSRVEKDEALAKMFLLLLIYSAATLSPENI